MFAIPDQPHCKISRPINLFILKGSINYHIHVGRSRSRYVSIGAKIRRGYCGRWSSYGTSILINICVSIAAKIRRGYAGCTSYGTSILIGTKSSRNKGRTIFLCGRITDTFYGTSSQYSRRSIIPLFFLFFLFLIIIIRRYFFVLGYMCVYIYTCIYKYIDTIFFSIS